jgi:hypothetical protein
MGTFIYSIFWVYSTQNFLQCRRLYEAMHTDNFSLTSSFCSCACAAKKLSLVPKLVMRVYKKYFVHRSNKTSQGKHVDTRKLKKIFTTDILAKFVARTSFWTEANVRKLKECLNPKGGKIQIQPSTLNQIAFGHFVSQSFHEGVIWQLKAWSL